ncbi:MAG: diguanylate cyclase [Firmicutes bacterium]|nr:diguanylate cyclase [Alicyclobacillaceae bacterium]MCL6497176.1 diguanylate cyclase [Bacillota bacterium]
MRNRRPPPDLLDAWIFLLRQMAGLPYGVLLKDAKGRWRFANPQALDWFGLAGGPWEEKTDRDLLPAEACAACEASDRRALDRGHPVETVDAIGEHTFHTFKIPLKDLKGRAIGILAIVSAMTDRERAQREAERLRDYYAALAEVNELVARHPARPPVSLLREAATILERRVGALLVWIGWVNGERRRLEGLFPAPRPGLSALYEDLNLDLDGESPAAWAVRTGKTQLCLDVEREPSLHFLWDQYRRHGIRAVAAIPIARFGEVVAVMGVRAHDGQFFSEPLLRLLEHIALSLGMGLEAYERDRELEQLALYDPLTGLANRRLFFEQLRQACDQARRRGTGVGVGMLDLDGFKAVNDTLGHSAGDKLLQQVGARIVSLIRTADRVGRMGGDEFALLWVDLNRREELEGVARRVLQGLRAPFWLDQEAVYISASLGLTYFPADPADPTALLRHADLALYAAKDQGRDQYYLYRPAMEDRLQQESQLRNQVADWIAHDQIQLVFRPLRALLPPGALGAVVGVEALAADPEGKRLSEDLLDAPGLARPLGQTSLRLALAAQAHLEEAVGPLRLHVNIGAHYFLDPRFPEDLRELWEGMERAPAGGLMVEMTETAAVRDFLQAREHIARIAGDGIAVALDGFGSEAASLWALRHLPVAMVKIAPEWIQGMGEDPRDAALVAVAIEFARRLGVPAAAEGVDAADRLESLAEMGCAAVQGEAVAPLLSLEGLVDYLRRPSA